MSSVAPLQSHFDGGEVSPLLVGRSDAERYKSSLALCKNFIPLLQGPLAKRPGTMFAGTVKTSANKTRLVPFEFSTTQAYMLEFGATYIRFWANYGQVVVSSTPVEVTSPYAQADIFDLRFVQNADVLYIVHPKYPPMKLLRFSATNWDLAFVNFIDGPYAPIQAVDPVNFTLTAFSLSGNSNITLGSNVNVTACIGTSGSLIQVVVDKPCKFATGDQVFLAAITGTTEANGSWTVTRIDSFNFLLQGSSFAHGYVSGGQIWPVTFVTTDAGRLIRIEAGTTWSWATITSYIGPTRVNIQIQTTIASGTLNSFRLGAFSQTTGYPGTACFHEDRLSFAGCPGDPERIFASNTSDYENFAPTQPDGTVIDSNALTFGLNANDVNLVEWLNSDEKALLGGTTSAEWTIRPSLTSEAMTPTNISAKRSTKWGSTSLQPVTVSKSTMYIQRGGRKLREFMYYFDIDGYRSTDMTELAEHITGTGVIDIAYQSIPISCVWLVRNDGVLIGMTYDRDMSQLRSGWHQHYLGGQSDASGTIPIVESIGVIPSPDGTRDDLWLIVQRWINGSVVRTVEFMTKIFEDIDPQQNAFMVDCGLTLNNPIAITAVTIASTAVVTAPSHGLSTGNQVRFDNVLGLVQTVNGATTSLLNNGWFTVTVLTTNTLSLTSVKTGAVVSSVGFTPYVSSGQMRKLVTTISGLTYLQGETVAIWADGAVQPPQVVNSSGQITLELPAAVVSVGYVYNSDAQLLRLEAGSRNGTSMGKTRRTHRAGFMLHRTLGLKAGKDFNNLDPLLFRTEGADLNDRAVPLFTGIHSSTVEFDYDFDNQICMRADTPAPCTILAIMPMLETQDRV